METVFDEIDIEILKQLQANSRLSVRELSSKVHRSPTAVFERVHRMEQKGVIKAYTINLDIEKIGLGFVVFCNVKLRKINTEIHEQFAEAVLKMPEVVECFNVSGSFDYLLKVQVPDMKSYRRFVTERLGRLNALESVQSVFCMQTIKQEFPVAALSV